MEKTGIESRRLKTHQARLRFAKLQRSERVFERSDAEYPEIRKIEQVFLDKQLGLEQAGWRRHYTDEEFDAASQRLTELEPEARPE